jgi:predicted RNase H-like nuclease (RuvC/YqgF family)
MEKRFTYLLGLSKHTENYLMYNELKELKKEVLEFPALRIEAMEKRIKQLEMQNKVLKGIITEQEQENELLTAKLEALKNYYGQE